MTLASIHFPRLICSPKFCGSLSDGSARLSHRSRSLRWGCFFTRSYKLYETGSRRKSTPGFELRFWLPSTDTVALLLKLAAPVRTRERSAGCLPRRERAGAPRGPARPRRAPGAHVRPGRRGERRAGRRGRPFVLRSFGAQAAESAKAASEEGRACSPGWRFFLLADPPGPASTFCSRLCGIFIGSPLILGPNPCPLSSPRKREHVLCHFQPLLPAAQPPFAGGGRRQSSGARKRTRSARRRSSPLLRSAVLPGSAIRTLL